jgi:subfamily B ATP-binding cassette protein MsbA
LSAQSGLALCGFAFLPFPNLQLPLFGMQIYRRLFAYTRPYRYYVPPYILAAMLSVLFGAANFTLIIPLLNILFDTESIRTLPEAPVFRFDLNFIKESFNYHFIKIVLQKGKMQALYFVCGLLLVSVFCSNVFRFVAASIINRTRLLGLTRLQRAIFRKLLAQPASYFTDARKGDLMSRLSNDVREVESALYNELKTLFIAPFEALVFFSILIFISWELTLFALLVLPFAGATIGIISKNLRKYGKSNQEKLAMLLNQMDEAISGIKIIQAFQAERFIIAQFENENEKYRRFNLKANNLLDLSSPLSEFLGILTVSGIILFGSSLIFSGRSGLEAADFIAYVAIFSQIIPPLKAFALSIARLQKAKSAALRVLEIIDLESPVVESPTAQKLGTFEKEIVFENVSFAYDKKEVLKNINLTIKKGQTVALVGASGGGKSTLADMLPRFLEPISGRILIDGQDLKQYQIQSLREKIGIVTQEAILFNASAAQNITLGLENVSQEEIEEAAQIAYAHDFIAEKGYHTPLGERGGKLSGGQKQRLSIARAVLKKPQILILDEATSALDSASEQFVQKALENLMRGRTAIVIAHRLSTIQKADKIVVLHQGSIVEEGDHQTLIAKNGYYAKLTQMQQL